MQRMADRSTSGRVAGWLAARRAVWIGSILTILLLTSPILAADAAAADCPGLSVTFEIAGCEVSLSGLGGGDGATTPTVGVRLGGVECTYKPLDNGLGMGGMLKCIGRVLRPFVHVEDS